LSNFRAKMNKKIFRDITYIKSKDYQRNKKNYLIYFISIFFIYLFFCFIYWINQIIFAKTNNIKNIQDIILKFRIATLSTDSKLSNFLWAISNITTQLQNHKRPFTEKNWNFRILLNYLSSHPIPNLWQLNEYKDFLNFSKKFLEIEKQVWYKDIFKLLKPWKTYLVILENIGEIRPNWWFFGSYWVIKIFNTGVEIKIFDAYYPVYIKKVYIPIKEKFLQKLISWNKINFISPNIRWFSNLDGKNIKTLYEKTFSWEKINWVIFIKSSLFEKLNKNFKNQIYEWQFINASIDLIRWKKLPFKKEIYLKQINHFIQKNKFKILKQIIKNRKQIIKNWQIYLYLPTISKILEKFLENNHLIFKKDPNCFYFFDFNFGYNKIDRFLEKDIFIISGEDILFHLKNKNKFCLTWKNYNKNIKIKIIYTLNIPETYTNFIKNLEKKYRIKLTKREKIILWLIPYVHNKWIIYRPESFNQSPTIYDYFLTKNHTAKIIKIKFK